MDQEEFKKLISGLDELNSIMWNPCVVLNSLTGYVFSSYLTPDELRLPDPFPELPSSLEILPIDLLGKYVPEKLEISIYSKRIEQVANVMGVHEFPLLEIVLLHEWAHALVHVGLAISEDQEILKEKKKMRGIRSKTNSIFDSISENTHELIAQLLTFHGVRHICKNNSRYSEMNLLLHKTFEDLQKLQPHRYQIDEFREVDIKRIVTAVDLLKSGDLQARSLIRVLKMT